MFLRHSSSSRALAAAAGGAFLLGLAAATPARAMDDGADNIFSSIASLLTMGVGIGGSEKKAPIEYRERAPLVLPPNLQQLPPPGAGVAARNAAWPQDFDQERHRRSMARERNARDPYDATGGRNAPGPTGGAVARSGDPRECQDDPMERLCNPNQFWSTMRNTRSQEEQKVAVGQEPPRRALTDPPAGFRRQSTAQQYTFEVERRIDEADPRAQRIEEERRRAAIGRGENPNF
jgi:hypothetical protein